MEQLACTYYYLAEWSENEETIETCDSKSWREHEIINTKKGVTQSVMLVLSTVYTRACRFLPPPVSNCVSVTPL